jgi:hypothetical protein
MKRFFAILVMVLTCAVHIVPVYAAETVDEIRPGIYSLDNEDTSSGELILTYANDRYEANIELISPNGHSAEFYGTAIIDGNKISIKNSDAQIIVTVKDGTAIIEANDEAESHSEDRVSFSGTYQVNYYENRNAAVLGNLISRGAIPQYVQDKGTFHFEPNCDEVKITGNNVRLRSQPNTEARVIANVNNRETLSYYGEWVNPKGEKWILVGYNPELYDFEELVWVYGQYAEPVEQ